MASSSSSKEGDNDNFNKIVISQTEGGGFESDNHTFRVGTGKYNPTSVPEPGMIVGLATVGGFFIRKRQKQKTLA